MGSESAAASTGPCVDGRLSLIGLSHEALAGVLAQIGERPFRARQLWHWIYYRGARDFQAMTSLPLDLRARLDASFSLARPLVSREQTSLDGSRKWLLRFVDGNEAESVLIPEADRGALCISSQVGCSLTCSFCHTGTQRLVRNLDAGEMVAQMLVARDSCGEWPSPVGQRLLSNVVLMGMGEPLLNYDNVAAAIRILMDPAGINLSRRRITLSTAGVVPVIHRVGAELGVKLAISLHAATDELRDILVPINRKYPIAELMAAVRAYPGADNARRITFEYVMLDGVNDTPADARALVQLVRGLPCKFNLIPFNPWPGAAYACSSDAAMARFAAILNAAGYTAPIRTPRGRDILAACGQLRSASERQRRAPSQHQPASIPGALGI